MPPTYLPQMVNLEVNDVRLIRQVANHAGLGDRGFSAALRIIIREWALTNQIKRKRFREYNEHLETPIS
jgi:hypothetical protein